MRYAPRSGLALLIVVGVLGLLAVLATAFVTMAQLERRASRQRLHATKAALLARSGIEDALARLAAGQDPSLPDTAYGGEDFDGNGLLDPGVETAEQLFNPTTLDTDACPIRQALRPSFFVGDRSVPGVPPALAGIDGRRRGLSGRLAGDLKAGTHVYALKVEDESAKINVNGGFLDALNRDTDALPDHCDPDVRANPADPKDTGLGWNFQLARILDILGAQPEVGIPALGTKILANRPPGGYRAIAQLQAALNTTQDLSPWLTVSSWVDTKVVHPNGNPTQFGSTSLGEVKRNRSALRLEEAGRPPVNLNAASRPVLLSLLADLSGKTWHHPRFPQDYSIPTPTTPMAGAIADALIAFRRGQDPDGIFLQAGLTPGPFDSWSRFSAFCDALVPSVINGMNANHLDIVTGGNLCGADLLKANFDPNTASNKELPDQIKWRWIDKTDLSIWSTEGSFGPTGTFRISCVGRILDKDARLLAQAEVSSTLEVFSLLRQTSQKDFLAGRTPDDTPTSCLSLAGNPLEPGPSTTFASAEAPWKTWSSPEGLAVVTYPNPPGAAFKGITAEQDGWIALATVEMEPSAPELLFLHHFDDGWDADVGRTALKSPGPNGSLLQTDVLAPVWPDPTLPLARSQPGTLYPDGMHGQWGRSPAYRALGNLPPPTLDSGSYDIHAVLSYWTKPMKSTRSYSDSTAVDFSCVRWDGNNTQVALVARQKERWGCVVERWANTNANDQGYERTLGRQEADMPYVRLPGLRWELATVFWDTAADRTRDVKPTSQGILPPEREEGVYPGYGQDLGENLVPDTDARMVLGGQKVESGFTGFYYGNQVVDEFAILDFGPDAGIAFPAHEDWAARRYKDGRYHKGKPGGDQGAFLSAELKPEPGAEVRLLNARWTGYLPREARKDMVHDYGAPPPEGTPRPIDPVLADPVTKAPHLWIEVHLLDGNGTLATSPSLRRLGQGTPINLLLPGFRYRVNFVNDIDVDDLRNSPILETPFFDDITFAWQRAGGPRVTTWSKP